MTTTASSTSLRRPRRLIALVFVLVVALSVAGAVAWSVVAANDDDKTARVGGDGVSLSVAGTRISAPAGVAPEGAQLRAAATPMDVSEVAWGGATALRDGVEITLEGDAQPQQPVQLQFTIPEDVRVPDDAVVVAVNDSPQMDKPQLLPAQWDPDTRTVTTTTEHFSKIGPAFLEAKKVLDGIGHAVHKMVTSGTDQPACFGHDPLGGPGQIVVKTQDTHAAWPCLTMEGDELVLELQNNSPLIWEIYAKPDPASATPVANSSAGILTASLFPVLKNSNSDGVMLQQESAKLTYNVEDLPAHVSLDGMPAMMLVGILATVADEFMPPGWTEIITGAECLNDVADSILNDNMEDLSVITLKCFSLAAGEGGGIIITMLTAAPAALYGSIYGAAGEVIDGNTASYDVELNVPATASRLEEGKRYLWEVASSGGMLTPRPSGQGVDELIVNDGRASLWASGTSQWVGCDGDTARTRYHLDGDYTALAATPALRAGTPEGLTARFDFEVDGQQVHTATVTTGTIGTPFDLDLLGADELTVTATTSDKCTLEKTGYGVLRATVTEASGEDVDIAALTGTWSGTVEQHSNGYDSYDIEVELTEEDDELKGAVRYPQLNCGGTWTQDELRGGAVVLKERITDNTDERCARTVEVWLSPTAEGAEVRLRAPSGQTADATITRP